MPHTFSPTLRQLTIVYWWLRTLNSLLRSFAVCMFAVGSKPWFAFLFGDFSLAFLVTDRTLCLLVWFSVPLSDPAMFEVVVLLRLHPATWSVCDSDNTVEPIAFASLFYAYESIRFFILIITDNVFHSFIRCVFYCISTMYIPCIPDIYSGSISN